MTNILVPKLFGLAQNIIFAFSAPSFSVVETLHVAYKLYKIKRKITFFVINTKYISSHELKTSEFSHMLCKGSDQTANTQVGLRLCWSHIRHHIVTPK